MNTPKHFALWFINSVFRFPFLRSYRDFLLGTWMTPSRRSGFNEKIYRFLLPAWMQEEYFKEPDVDRRIKKQELLMGSENGANWAQYYDEQPFPPEKDYRMGNLSFEKAFPIFGRLEKKLSQPKPLVVLQIGSSSGREIAWLASQFPQHTYIGTDVYRHVVDYSRRSHQHANLSFVELAAHKTKELLIQYKNIEVVVFSSGSLQYVQPEHLEIFFGTLSEHPHLSLWLNEPASELNLDPRELQGSSPRGNLSYTHDYGFYAEKYGFKIVSETIVRPYVPYEQFPQHKGTTHYELNCTNVT